jgi:hypothetical protein
MAAPIPSPFLPPSNAIKPRRGIEDDANQMRNDMTKSEQLEREAERVRAHLAKTAIELRTRLTPRHAVNQLFDLSSNSAALGILRNLRDKTVANPLAVGIVGAGMAWLMYSRRRETRRPDEASNLAQRGTFSGDAAKRAEEREVNPPPGL